MFQEIRPGAGFKTGDFVQDKVGGGGGATVERLRSCFFFQEQKKGCTSTVVSARSAKLP